jgi:4'-phosphopantetheinyl transferase
VVEIAYLDINSTAAERLTARFANAQDHHLANRYRHPHGQRQRLMVRALLRAVLARYYPVPDNPWQILRGPYGAPHLAADGLTPPLPFVSLSHSGDLVACAVSSSAPVGIDIEQIRVDRPIMALAQAAFGPTEAAAVEADGIDAFYRIWTLREALAKASGAGFGLLMNRTDLVPPTLDGTAPSREIQGVQWDFAYWRLPESYGLGLARAAMPNGGDVTVPVCLSDP